MRSLALTGPVLAVLAWTALAGADALPPQLPITCPRGSQVVHNHGGTHCETDPPKDCPVGWRGRLGGNCVLEICGSDDACGGKGRVCRKVDLCSHVDEHWGDATESPRSSLLAAPPRKMKARFYTDLCRSGACSAPDTCGAYGVCLPSNVTSPGAKPANAIAAIGYDVGAVEPPVGTPPPQPTSEPQTAVDAGLAPIVLDPPVTEPRLPGKSGGCAGCSAVQSANSGGALVAIALALALRARRVRRR